MSYEEEMSEYEANTSGGAHVKKTKVDENGNIELELLFRAPDEDMIATALAQRMMADYSLSKEMRDKVSNMVVSSLQAQMDQFIGALIGEQLVKPFPVVNKVTGEPTGETRTLKELITHYIDGWQSVIVNADGKPAGNDSYNIRHGVTREQWLINSVAGGAFEKAAKEAVVEVMKEAKTTQAEKLKAIVSAAIGGLLK